MALFHLQLDPIKRSLGESAHGNLAYILRNKLINRRPFGGGRTKTFNYLHSKKRDELAASGVIGWDGSAQELADAMEQREGQWNSFVGRKTIIALPHELTPDQNADLCEAFTEWLCAEYQIAAVWAYHLPSSGEPGASDLNHHCHLALVRRVVGPDRHSLGKTLDVLDDFMTTGPQEVRKIRMRWADMVNSALERAGHDVRISAAKTKRPQYLKKKHLGSEQSAAERRGERTRTGDWNREVDRLRVEDDALEDRWPDDQTCDFTPDQIVDLVELADDEIADLVLQSEELGHSIRLLEEDERRVSAQIEAAKDLVLTLLAEENRRLLSPRTPVKARPGTGTFTGRVPPSGSRPHVHPYQKPSPGGRKP